MQTQAANTTSYTFTQQPKSVSGRKGKSKFRPPDASQGPAGSNLMWDKRIIRGNTYSAQVLPLSAQTELALAEKEALEHRRRITQEKKRLNAEAAKRSTTPDAVEGRKHTEIQTEQYLEELTDKVEEATVDTQTDPMMDRPPTPLFVPFKTGRDTETQIEEGDLFNFDHEVDPILEVMVGKTLEQAMLEVQQEDELEALRQQQRNFQQSRREEQIEFQRLEAQEKRKYDEKERRKKQEMERLKREKVTKEKLASRMYSQQFLLNLENKVFARLEDEGWFHDSVERQVETEYMPWLLDQMDKSLDKKRRTKNLVDELMKLGIARGRSMTTS